MLKPDVVVVIPLHIDMPIFRYQIRKYRHFFGKVIIAFSDHHVPGVSYEAFTRKVMASDDVIFVDALNAYIGDWRDVAVKEALKLSTAKSVLFLEPDFLVVNEDLFSTVLQSDADIIGFHEFQVPPEKATTYDFERLHPAFLLMPRAALEKTRKDFAAHPPIHDHFGAIFEDLKQQQASYLCLENLGLRSPKDWIHVAGVTHSYTCMMRGDVVPTDLARFAQLNRDWLALDIEQHPEFVKVMQRATTLS